MNGRDRNRPFPPWTGGLTDPIFSFLQTTQSLRISQKAVRLECPVVLPERPESKQCWRKPLKREYVKQRVSSKIPAGWCRSTASVATDLIRAVMKTPYWKDILIVFECANIIVTLGHCKFVFSDSGTFIACFRERPWITFTFDLVNVSVYRQYFEKGAAWVLRYRKSNAPGPWSLSVCLILFW